MKAVIRLTAAVLSLGACALPQNISDQLPKGAKALYYDQTSGATVQSNNEARNPRRTTSPQRNTGLKYWVELVQPDSAQILRVSSTRAFHSGEHIRLHFESNVDGRIVLVQMNPNGTSQLLFPDQRIDGGDNRIKAGTDTTVPAGNAWFAFDNNPGTERILVFLNVDSGPGSTSSPAKDSGTGNTVSSSTLPSSSDGKLDTVATNDLAARVEKQRGSKSLVLEVDDKGDAPADYVVKPASYKQGSAASENTLAIEIQLKHQ